MLSCSICFETSDKGYKCSGTCTDYICINCLKEMLKTNKIDNLVCPNCKKHIKIFEIYEVFGHDEMIKLLDELFDTKFTNYIINNVQRVYPIFSELKELMGDIRRLDMITDHDEDYLPLPTTTEVPNYKPSTLFSIYTIKENVKSQNDIWLHDFLDYLTNLYFTNRYLYDKVHKRNRNRMVKFYNNRNSKISYFIDEKLKKYLNTNSNNDVKNNVIMKCKKCRFGLIISKLSDSELDELESKLDKLELKFNMTHPASEHEQLVKEIEELKSKINDEYKCNSCHQKYCPKCLEIIETIVKSDSPFSSSKEHHCKKENIESWNEIRNNSKSCPCCGTRIYKTKGCNDMFCTNCHNGFKYDTGKIIQGSFHNQHRVDWLNNNSSHFNNTDISGVEQLNNMKFNRLLDYHNDLMTKYLNYTVSVQERDNINNDKIELLVKAYYNDIENPYEEKYTIGLDTFNLEKIINREFKDYIKYFSVDLIQSVYTEIIDLIYSNLVKVINEPQKYLTDDFYNMIIDKMSKYSDLLIKYEDEFDLYDIEHFLYDELPVKGFERISHINYKEMGITNINDLYDLIEDLNNTDKEYDENMKSVCCLFKKYDNYSELVRFIRRFKFPDENIRHSYYLNKPMINNLI